MDVRRISFIEAKSPGANIFSKCLMPRLGAVLLSTILTERGYEVKAFIEDVADPDWSYIENSDVVCISTITSTSVRAYRIADGLRRKGIPVVMGGAHPSFLPEEALKHADYVVRGEGDFTLPELIDYLKKGTPDITSIKGLSYRDSGDGIINNSPRPLIEDLDVLPEPDFKLVPHWKPSNIYPISTSRGCPFNCKFCSVIHIFGRKYRFKTVAATMKELRHVHSISGASKFFVDDNFTANKKRTKELLRAMIAEGITSSWSAQVRTDVAKDEELLRLMADSGCDTLHIGFESVSQKTLQAYNKGQDIDEIVHCIKIVRDHGIEIHGMFVLGADTDTIDTIKETADFSVKLGIDTIQFLILTPLPGTPLFYEMKESGRLLHTDWSKYDGHHIVYKPLLMSPQTLHIESLKAMGRFYSWKYIFRHFAHLDFFHAAVGLYGKRAIKKALEEAGDYLQSISKLIDSPLPEQS
ncbi:MAG: radical SAM protein [Thermodesulfovibrionales bacterium]|nr:radical SAM protein [Thermodesulfovibrionales bacterium]